MGLGNDPAYLAAESGPVVNLPSNQPTHRLEPRCSSFCTRSMWVFALALARAPIQSHSDNTVPARTYAERCVSPAEIA